MSHNHTVTVAKTVCKLCGTVLTRLITAKLLFLLSKMVAEEGFEPPTQGL